MEGPCVGDFILGILLINPHFLMFFNYSLDAKNCNNDCCNSNIYVNIFQCVIYAAILWKKHSISFGKRVIPKYNNLARIIS